MNNRANIMVVTNINDVTFDAQYRASGWLISMWSFHIMKFTFILHSYLHSLKQLCSI